jgi:hypothetical protein
MLYAPGYKHNLAYMHAILGPERMIIERFYCTDQLGIVLTNIDTGERFGTDLKTPTIYGIRKTPAETITRQLLFEPVSSLRRSR